MYVITEDIIEDSQEFNLGDGGQAEEGDVALILVEGECIFTPQEDYQADILEDGDMAVAQPQAAQFQTILADAANMTGGIVRFGNGVRNFSVNVTARGGRVKVSIIKFFGNFWPADECEWCQKILKILLSSILGDAVGTGIEFGEAVLPDNATETIADLFDHEPFIWIRETLNNSHLGNAVSSLLKRIQQVRDTRDNLVRTACEDAGFCPP